jgi:hypothetical protein
MITGWLALVKRICAGWGYPLSPEPNFLNHIAQKSGIGGMASLQQMKHETSIVVERGHDRKGIIDYNPPTVHRHREGSASMRERQKEIRRRRHRRVKHLKQRARALKEQHAKAAHVAEPPATAVVSE